MTVTDTQSGFASINGAQIYYTIDGAEHPETMVMIHAGICDHRMWSHQVTHFAKRYKIVTFDMRGFGQSKMVEGAFSLVDDAHTLLDTLDIEQAWLMACSQGGKVALDLTLQSPERVTGLLLVAPAISGYQYEGEPHPLSDAFDEADDAGDIARICELEMQVWVDGTGRKPEDVDPVMRQLVYDMNFIPLNVPDELWEQERETESPALPRLESIDKPALLVAGPLDVASSLERVNILAERIDSIQLVMMENTAHLPNLEYPEKFNQIVDEFLGKL